MLEEAVDDGDDANVLGEARHLGTQAADSTYDEVDPHPRRTRLVQLLDEASVDEGVHLRDDPRGLSRPRVIRLTADALDHALAHAVGGEDQVVEPARPCVAGEEIEELRQVFAKGLTAGEDAQVPIEAARANVVVPRGEVAVAPNAIRFLAHDEAGLAVRLESRHPVHDVGAHLFQGPRPADVRSSDLRACSSTSTATSLP